ncbi:hypothetical protein CMK11_07930 [Candidatus Poribacteria bacterium]|nr:hypothetical protein [Candidatus Poribacteria bacterium]
MRKVIATGIVGCVIACGLAVAVSGRSQGGPTIAGSVAVVDTERVFEEYTETQKAQKVLDNALSTLEERGKELDDEIRALEERLTKQRLFIEDESKVRLMEDDIRQKRADLQDLVRLGQEALAEKQDELTEPILQEIRDTIRTVGEDDGFDLLLERRLVVLYHRDGMDITDRIITLLNDAAAAKAGEDATATSEPDASGGDE